MTGRFLVTDTHPLLWYTGKRESKLSKRALSAFKSAQEGTGTYIYVPAAVLWEISLLLKKTRRVTSMGTLEELARNNFFAKSMSILDLQIDDILRAHALELINDPFDALIVGTAQRMDLPLITADSAIIDSKHCAIFWD